MHSVIVLRLAGCLVGVLTAGLLAVPAAADGPPAPGPYPQLEVKGSDSPGMTCRDRDGTVLYADVGWTLEPLVRGPSFAPVVLWLPALGNAPVMPLEFELAGFPIWWSTVDGGPAEAGNIETAAGRPVVYGSPPTDQAERVTCFYEKWGFWFFGTYLITVDLARVLGLPASVIGRRVTFSNEGQVSFSVPRYLFPSTAAVVAPTLPTADFDRYGRRPLPTTTCRAGGTTIYRGLAYTFAPLTRGYRWAPMALWLRGDRIVTPRWFTSTVTGTWRTVSGTPARSGRLDVTQQGRPAGYGRRPANATAGVRCDWAGSHDTTTTVTAALAAQLDLPVSLIGRRVALRGDYRVRAFSPHWLFPPAN